MRHFRDAFDILWEQSESMLSMATKIVITTHSCVCVRRISYTAYKQISSSLFCSKEGNCANVIPCFCSALRATRAPFPGLSCSLHSLAGSASGSLAIHLRLCCGTCQHPDSNRPDCHASELPGQRRDHAARDDSRPGARSGGTARSPACGWFLARPAERGPARV